MDTLLREPAGGTDTGASCPLCARPRTADDARGLAWSSQHEPDGTVTWICDRCTRAELWRIEIALPVTPAPARRAHLLTSAGPRQATERNAG